MKTTAERLTRKSKNNKVRGNRASQIRDDRRH